MQRLTSERGFHDLPTIWLIYSLRRTEIPPVVELVSTKVDNELYKPIVWGFGWFSRRAWRTREWEQRKTASLARYTMDKRTFVPKEWSVHGTENVSHNKPKPHLKDNFHRTQLLLKEPTTDTTITVEPQDIWLRTAKPPRSIIVLKWLL